MVMRENEIVRRLREVLVAALGSLGVSGFEVFQSRQPLATLSHGVIVLDRISVRRYGWQGSRYEKTPEDDPNSMTETVDYIDEAVYQVSAYRPRRAGTGKEKGDTVATLTSSDVISALHMWLFSDFGLDAFSKNGLQVFRSSDIRLPVDEDDSNSPQFNPNFDLRVVICHDASFRIGAISDPDAVKEAAFNPTEPGPLANPHLSAVGQGHFTEAGPMARSILKEGR